MIFRHPTPLPTEFRDRNFTRPLIVHQAHGCRRATLRYDLTSGTVHLRVPKRLPVQSIHSLLEEKRGWLREKIAHETGIVASLGDTITLLGSSYRFVVIPHRKNHLWMTHDTCTFHGPGGASSRRAFQTLIANVLHAYALEKIQTYSAALNVSCAQLTIRAMKSRWGSCHTNGTITLAWSLVCAPRTILDYVIAHEVAHLKHMNHSPEFWNAVRQLEPGAHDARTWLRRHGSEVTLKVRHLLNRLEKSA